MRERNFSKLTLSSVVRLMLIVLIIAGGVFGILLSRAASFSKSVEVETNHAGGSASEELSSSASAGGFIKFGPNIPLGGASPGGTYADWWYPGSGLTSIEWTVVPVQDPPQSLTTDGLLHYYAYTFGVNNQTSNVGYGYAGFQTNGIFQGIFKGKVINFSMWGNSGGKSPSPGLVNNNNQESGGAQIMFPFIWTAGHQYRFQLKPGPSGTDATGKWWGLYVTDLQTSITTFIGEERVQTSINGKDSSLIEPHTGAFGEDLHWWRSLSGSTKYRCQDFQNSSMAIINISGNNGSVLPNNFNAYTNSLQASTDPNNGYQTTNCVVSVYKKGTNVQMNLGNWSPAAIDILRTLP